MRVLAQEKAEAQKKRLVPEGSKPSEGFGKFGGLPQLKPELQALARECGVSEAGTVADLKARISAWVANLPATDAVARGVTTAVLAEAQRREPDCEMPPGMDRASSTGASSSAGPPTPIPVEMHEMVRSILATERASVATPSSTEVEQMVRTPIAGEQQQAVHDLVEQQVNQRLAGITTETVMAAAGLSNASEQVRLAVEAEVARVSRASVAAVPERHPVMPEVLMMDDDGGVSVVGSNDSFNDERADRQSGRSRESRRRGSQ